MSFGKKIQSSKSHHYVYRDHKMSFGKKIQSSKYHHYVYRKYGKIIKWALEKKSKAQNHITMLYRDNEKMSFGKKIQSSLKKSSLKKKGGKL